MYQYHASYTIRVSELPSSLYTACDTLLCAWLDDFCKALPGTESARVCTKLTRKKLTF